MKRSASDPFLQHAPMPYTETYSALGVPVQFEANRRWLLARAHDAYGGMPALDDRPPVITVRLLANNDVPHERLESPPLPVFFGTAEMTSASYTPSNMLMCAVQTGRGFVTVSPAMAHMRYIIRYEMIEFVVYRLLQHYLGAVGLHGACITRDGTTRLLFGESGAGKSTLVMACLLQGWHLLGEDAMFLLPRQAAPLRGVPTYIHLLPDSLSYFPDVRLTSQSSSIITRRSGRQKLEVDTRVLFKRPAQVEAPLGSAVFISRVRSEKAQLRRIAASRARTLLDRHQPYGRRLPNWEASWELLLEHPAYEMQLGADPIQAAQMLNEIP